MFHTPFTHIQGFIHSSQTLIDLLQAKAEDVSEQHMSGEMPCIGFVGYPNVGKSSTIVALCAQKAVPISSTPGRTRHFQTINMPGNFQLCDCPGLVFPNFANTKAEMVCNGILPIDRLTEHIGPLTHVCRTISRLAIEKAYGIRIIKPATEDPDQSRPPTAYELIDSYGIARGKMDGRGSAHGPEVARPILKDYFCGAKLRHCALPPDTDVYTTTPQGVTTTGRAADPTPTDGVYAKQQIVGTHAFNQRYVSEVDVEFFKDVEVRGIAKDRFNVQKGNQHAGSSKKHFKGGRKEKGRRLDKQQNTGRKDGSFAGFSVL
jgi:large subunit GTPase 1